MKRKNFIISAIFFVIINLIAQALGVLNIEKMIPWVLEKAPMEGTIFEVHYSYGAQIVFKGFLSLFALIIVPTLIWVFLVILEALSALSQGCARRDFQVFLTFLEEERLEKNIFLIILEKIFFLLLFPIILTFVILKRIRRILKFVDPLVV
ncbi:MAG TPA: hypothetical protein PK142_01270 [bacterium]|nr:hypothetical protein [bacterium]